MQIAGLRSKILSYLKNIWFLWALCLILNIITFLVIFFKIHSVSTTLALRYNVLAGVLWYGRGSNLYFIPAVGLAISAVNFAVYRAVRDRHELFSWLPVFASLFGQTILLAATLFLIKIN